MDAVMTTEPIVNDQPVEREGQDDARTDKYWLDLAKIAYSGSTTYFDAYVRPAIEQGIRQFQGRHATGSKYLSEAYKLKSKTFRPKTRTAIRKHEASAAMAFFSTEDVVNIRPDNDDDVLQAAAVEAYKYLLQRRLARNSRNRSVPWFLIACAGYQEAMSSGTVAGKWDWEHKPKKDIDRPVARLIPSENLRLDPGADWTDPINSSPFVIELVPMYVKDVKAKMRDGKWKPLTEQQMLSARSGGYDSTRMVREGKADSKENSTAINDFTIVWVHEVVMEHDGQDLIYYTMGTEHLLTEPAPIKARYFHGQRPWVLGHCIIEAHKVYKSSLCDITRDQQNEINDLANQRLENIKLVLNKRYQVLRNKQVDLRSITRNTAGSVTLVSDHNDIKVIDTNDITSSSYAEQDRLDVAFDDLVGGFSGSSVANNRKLNETVGGMNLLSTSANLVGEYQLRTYTETFIEPFLQLFLEMERHYETDTTLLTNAMAAAGLGQEEMTGENIQQVLDQEVYMTAAVGMNNTNPQVQVERFVYGLSSLSKFRPGLMERLKDEEVVKELFGKLGYRDGARFFDMKKEVGNGAEAEIQRLTIDKLKAEIEQIRDTSAVKRVEAVLKRVETLYSSMQTAQVSASATVLAPAADAIARSAGFEDQDVPPIYPTIAGAAAAEPVPDGRDNTSPMFPPRPMEADQGMMTGIETPEADGVTYER
jgi:hypothetical protein